LQQHDQSSPQHGHYETEEKTSGDSQLEEAALCKVVPPLNFGTITSQQNEKTKIIDKGGIITSIGFHAVLFRFWKLIITS
jgi:hypothetical protein